jgi:hypothetical protein
MTHVFSVFIAIVAVGWYFIAMAVGFGHQSVRGHARKHHAASKKVIGKGYGGHDMQQGHHFGMIAHLLIIAPLYGSTTMLKWLGPHVSAGSRKLQKKGQDKHQDWQRKKDARQ